MTAPAPATAAKSAPSSGTRRILVANLGSTSFKYRLFELGNGVERELARAGYERVTDFGAVIQDALTQLANAGHLRSTTDVDAVGFKTVLGRDLSGCVRADLDDTVLDALEGYAAVAPSHNPAYAAGIRQFRALLPGVPLVALFETAFYQWTPAAGRRYAVPESWYEAGVRRFGFHGASHKYIAERSAVLLGREDVAERVRGLYSHGPGTFNGPPLRVVSCHLGGSSSVTGIANGVAMGTSMGFSPQSGLPQNNRVGDLDAMAVPFALEHLGLTLDQVKQQLTKEGGLLGLSGVSNDLRDIVAAAREGNARAQLALDAFASSVRHWTGALAWAMGGLEALVFTAGIGENNSSMRAAICRDLEGFGLHLDPVANATTVGEGVISAASSTIRVLVIPTNEELVVARETARLLG